jgi:ribosomal protein S27AE
VKMKMAERSIDASGRIVLVCSGCGELVILLGHENDWYREHRNAFGCSGCGKRLTLADRVDRKAYRIRTLLRSSIRPFINLGI